MGADGKWRRTLQTRPEARRHRATCQRELQLRAVYSANDHEYSRRVMHNRTTPVSVADGASYA